MVSIKGTSTGWAVITGDDDWILRVDEDNKEQLMSEADAQLIADAPLLLAEVKQFTENKILAKYRDIVQKYDDALLADGDTDPRWSELYELQSL